MKIDKESLRLENDFIYLHSMCLDDITEEYVNGLNDPEVNKYLEVRRNPQTHESVEKFIFSNMEDPSSIFLGVFIKNICEPFVGTIRVHGIDFYHYSASIGICLFAKRVWKKGYAIQSLQLVKEYLFSVLGLHYLEAGVFAKNPSSVNLFNSASFSEIYRVKDKYRHVDSFEEVIFLGVTNPAFDMSLLWKKF